MNTFYGNTLLIYNEMKWYFGRVLFLYITIPLMIAWIITGLVFNLHEGVITSIPVPAYIHIVLFSMVAFKMYFPIAIGMGSTRIHFLKAFYVTGLGVVAFTILFLNFCQYIMIIVYNQLFGWSSILHPAIFFRPEYQFLPYLWIDIMFGLFIFGLSFLLFCAWYRLGSVRMLFLITVLTIICLFLYYGGVLETWFQWVRSLGLDAVIGFTILGSLGLFALFSTYPMMRDASLNPKPR
ncbi:hypothetical protein [Candidatus Contubernalis alkaliaceticus]|uniref:hypothetical protein n=1 Tax=Candidatus Contubernalis alkaliaceticus TaxID=338645 RepID=UPI001F4BF42B|nr:hypothetical protein [Candidatus Contubernalis alkalaceticus]UNC92013.1 hypothetical protein HUE98_07820 [Candidatus Contubernalis alkalaceticus]